MSHPTRAGQHRAFKSYRIPVGVAVAALLTAGLVTGTAPAQAAAKVIPSNQVDLTETRVTGHNVFAGGVVHVYTEGSTSTDKAAGYFDVNKSLAVVAAVEPSMSWTPNGGAPNFRPGEQLKVDFNGDGSIDGILVGEPINTDGTPLYGNVWWLSNGSQQFVKDAAPSHAGGFGSTNNGTLAQWKTAFPAARVLQGGWSLGSGAKGDGFINNFVIGGDTYTFSAATFTTKVLSQVDVNTSETRSAGHNTFLPGGGIEILTDDNSSNAKSAGYFDTAALPLSQAGEPSMDYSNYAGALKPSVQLVVDFDGDGAPDGILVGEPTYANGSVLYGTDWWLSNGSSAYVKADAPQHGGGFGSDNHGQLSEWRNKFPNAKVIYAGWSLGSGVQGHGVINSITVGSTTYTFQGNTAPTAAPVTASTAFGTAKTVTLLGADAENDPLTYAVSQPAASQGTVSLAGDQATFTPAFGFVGNATFGYTVKDASHPAVASTVTITVGAPPTDPRLTVTSTNGPGANANKRSITLSGQALPNLPASGGFKVIENGVQRSGGVMANRHYTVSLGNGNAPGTHVYTVTYGGASSTIVVHAP